VPGKSLGRAVVSAIVICGGVISDQPSQYKQGWVRK
jgi:hypothetical protein